MDLTRSFTASNTFVTDARLNRERCLPVRSRSRSRDTSRATRGEIGVEGTAVWVPVDIVGERTGDNGTGEAVSWWEILLCRLNDGWREADSGEMVIEGFTC